VRPVFGLRHVTLTPFLFGRTSPAVLLRPLCLLFTWNKVLFWSDAGLFVFVQTFFPPPPLIFSPHGFNFYKSLHILGDPDLPLPVLSGPLMWDPFCSCGVFPLGITCMIILRPNSAFVHPCSLPIFQSAVFLYGDLPPPKPGRETGGGRLSPWLPSMSTPPPFNSWSPPFFVRPLSRPTPGTSPILSLFFPRQTTCLGSEAPSPPSLFCIPQFYYVTCRDPLRLFSSRRVANCCSLDVLSLLFVPLSAPFFRILRGVSEVSFFLLKAVGSPRRVDCRLDCLFGTLPSPPPPSSRSEMTHIVQLFSLAFFWYPRRVSRSLFSDSLWTFSTMSDSPDPFSFLAQPGVHPNFPPLRPVSSPCFPRLSFSRASKNKSWNRTVFRTGFSTFLSRLISTLPSLQLFLFLM